MEFFVGDRVRTRVHTEYVDNDGNFLIGTVTQIEDWEGNGLFVDYHILLDSEWTEPEYGDVYTTLCCSASEIEKHEDVKIKRTSGFGKFVRENAA